MKVLLMFILLGGGAVLSTESVLADSLNQDREAIKRMAGSFQVHFSFQETKAISGTYTIKPAAYREEAIEIVKVVEDQPKRITLQHLLVIEGKNDQPVVIKHWAQIWTYEDTMILDYCGEDNLHEWEKDSVSVAEVTGAWSQLVTQVDDTPRYESIGKWVHGGGESVWTSSLTRRPLPRREYTKRSDYDYILAVNTHRVTRDGWQHEQENQKVVDRRNREAFSLCYEKGLNTYRRVETEFTAVAEQWWMTHGAVWSEVREFWRVRGEVRPGKSFAYHDVADGLPLKKAIKRLFAQAETKKSVEESLSPYVDAK